MEVEVDWDKGLPPDVIALVAKAGGIKDMKFMRGISKSWKEGYELGVTSITVCLRHPVLPLGLEVAQRFTGLVKLEIGLSTTSVTWLETLHELPRLNSLALGGHPMTTNSLGLHLTDADMSHLQVCSVLAGFENKAASLLFRDEL